MCDGRLLKYNNIDFEIYMKLKKETDEIVGRINGKYATVNWTPIWYYYRAMDFEDLIDLFH